MRASQRGKIVSFYSYKGGTGRTMALTNVGYLLARESKSNRVLLVDWDLEAPGLHRYFRDLVHTAFPEDTSGSQFDCAPGLMDLFLALKWRIEGSSVKNHEVRGLLEQSSIDSAIVATDVPGLYLLKAGSFDERYANAVNSFSWVGLHALCPVLLSAFSELLAEQFSYVLVDSRTGLSDTGAICTSILPDILVVVFTPNRQSLFGALDAARNAVQFRKDSDDLRPLRILPLPSRIEAAEPILRDNWRFGKPEEGIPGYQPQFEHLFEAAYDLPDCDLNKYFSETQIQHVPLFAYGEQIAARMESDDRLSVTRSFQGFMRRIQSDAEPWEKSIDLAESAAAGNEPLRDDAWIVGKRSSVASALARIESRGLMEASFFLSKPLDDISARQSLRAVEAAQIPGAGWPIGAVLPASSAQRPRSTPDGVEAEIIQESTKSYDYWMLQPDGRFYFARSLEEDSEYLLLDDRIDRVAELLLYCQRLYSFLGADPASSVRITLFLSGLRGRELGCRASSDSEELIRLAGKSDTDSIQTEVVVEIVSIRDNLVGMVKALTRSLFSLFEFYEMSDREYERLVRRRLTDWGFDA
jgi:MinD-like ATPase involved in chromosome partitioning or flagellar assembly